MLVEAVSGATLFHAVVEAVVSPTAATGTIGLDGLFPFALLFLDPEPVIVPSIPMRVHLHVLLALDASLLVIFGLFLATQTVPLKKTYGLVQHKTVSA